MSAIKIEPLQEHELDEFITMYWNAFTPIEADMIAPMLFPSGLNPEVMESSKARIMRDAKGNLGESVFCARDATTNELMAGARWAIVEDAPQTPEETEARWQAAREHYLGNLSPQGMNVPLGEAFVKASIFSESEIMQGQPYMILKLLATHPKHHRKGAGGALLRAGLEKADRLNLPVYLEAANNGKILYERNGFVVQRDFPLDAREFGGRSQAQHWCMLRPKQNRTQ